MAKKPVPIRTQNLSDSLVDKGVEQLMSEIETLETWLSELDETRDSNIESLAARNNYMDMLQSRRELLDLLTE